MQLQFFPSKDIGLRSEPLPRRAPSIRRAPCTAGSGDGLEVPFDERSALIFVAGHPGTP